ncbi:DUF2577 domain-containing protein [Lysinibacillus fusiformis]|uniref:DUF2577 domain-containing protein n=1 Tax=Lysinibacillus fusiformis TaxID=28031 RepID=UPI002E215574|nr:DUF2577 domain-containing protein [Lysinibacillus fusiformis]
MSLLDLIKTTAMAAYHASNPVNIIVGEVIESKPLKIEVHSKLILTDEFLLVAEHLTKHERVVSIEDYELRFKQLIIEDGLKIGDKVIMHRVQGGQKYFVSDRYKEGDSVW